MAEIRVQDRTAPPAPAAPPPGRPVAPMPPVEGDPSIGDLFRQLAQDSTTLIRQEVALAKTEVRENVKTAARDMTMIAVGGAIAAVGGLVLTAFLVILLGSLLVNYWLAALIVGVIYLLVGGGLAWSNLNRLREADLKPEHTIDSLKEDKEWIQQEIREARRELT
jgi:uncharacterized membrane protein YqjE